MAEPTAPTAPSAVNTTVSAPKRTITIANLTQLEAYVNRTGDTLGAGGTDSGGPTYGDDVVLAVTTYNFTVRLDLPVPAGSQTGNDYVNFRSANLSSLPASGTRISRSDTANMPRINGPQTGLPVGSFGVLDNVDHYRFQGINFTAQAGQIVYSLLQFQSPSNTGATHASYMIVDRCLLHGDPTVQGAQGGLQGAGAHNAIIDSVIYDVLSLGSETHNVLWATGVGPYLMDNCEIEAGSCGVFVGDSSVVDGLHPANVTIRHNWIHRPANRNPYSYIYKTGTAALNGGGTVVTITTGVVDSAWADGSTYFTLLESANTTSGYFDAVRLILSVNTGANTITLTSAFPVLTGTSGKNYRITRNDNLLKYGVKNLFEVKDGNRILFDGNVFDTSQQQAQTTALTIASVHGDGAGGYDINFKNNYIRNCYHGINFLARPSVGSGTQWGSSALDAMPSGPRAGRVRVTTDTSHLAATGDTADIHVTSGTTEAEGIWTITVESATTFTIPVTYVGSSGNGVVVWQTGFPTSRVAVTNNVFEDIGSVQCHDDINNPSGRARFMTINNALDLGDAALSQDASGAWNMSDWLVAHNTVVCPSTQPDHQATMLYFANSGIGGKTYTILPMKNFAWRNNVMRLSDATYAPSSATGIVRADATGNAISYGKTALDAETESASRIFTYNAMFSPAAASVNSEISLYTSPESTANAWVTADTNVGFTSYVAGTVTNYALTSLYTTGTCTVTNGSPTVTGFTDLPGTIMKGTPFKNNANATYYLVLSRDSANQVTLQSNYTGSTNTGAFTLGFKGWSSELDGTDPGVNTTTLAAAISGVTTGTPSGGGGGSGFRYLPIRWP